MTRKKKRKTHRKKKNKKTTKITTSILFITIVIGAVVFFILNKKDLTNINQFDSDKYFIKGIDLSHHNPILEWENLGQDNLNFAYLKVTEGTSHEDRNYAYNYEKASKTNIKIGTYHFYSFAVSGKEQARHFIKNAKCKSGDLLPAIDVEHSPANPYSQDKDYVNLVIKELKILENELYEYYGVHPILYTNKDCYKLYIQNQFPNNLIWMCDLVKEPDETIKNWRIWQFSHTGQISGIKEKIDLNYYRYSFDEFKELLIP